MKTNRIIIFDTTLRDGEQCPGASMNLREKLEVARQLARLKVHVIEAGFPIASDGDFRAVKAISAGSCNEQCEQRGCRRQHPPIEPVERGLGCRNDRPIVDRPAARLSTPSVHLTCIVGVWAELERTSRSMMNTSK